MGALVGKLPYAARLQRFASNGSPLRRQLAGATAGSFALLIAAKVLALAANVLLARWLGASGYGMYATAMATLMLLSVPVALGLPILVVRMLAMYGARQEWGLMRGILARTNQAVFVISALISACGAIVVWGLSDRIPAAQAHALWWTMALLPVTALNALRAAALRGLHHVVLGQLPDKFLTPGLFVGFLLLVGAAAPAIPGIALTPGFVMALRFTATAGALVVGAWLLWRRLPPAIASSAPRYDTATWCRSAWPLLLVGGMGIISAQTDVLMLGTIVGPASAGLYRAASTTATLVGLMLMIVNTVSEPVISQLYANGELARLQRMITTTARVSLLLALPLALAFIVFGHSLLALVFGSEYTRAAWCLAILCLAQLVNAGAGLVGSILNMTGFEKDAALGRTLGALLNVLLNAALIPVWGIEGAAVATATSIVVWNLFLVVKVRQRTGLYSTVFTRA